MHTLNYSLGVQSNQYIIHHSSFVSNIDNPKKKTHAHARKTCYLQLSHVIPRVTESDVASGHPGHAIGARNKNQESRPFSLDQITVELRAKTGHCAWQDIQPVSQYSYSAARHNQPEMRKKKKRNPPPCCCSAGHHVHSRALTGTHGHSRADMACSSSSFFFLGWWLSWMSPQRDKAGSNGKPLVMSISRL